MSIRSIHLPRLRWGSTRLVEGLLVVLLLAGCLGSGAKGPECRQGEGLSAIGVTGASLSARELALVFSGPIDAGAAELGSYLALQNIRAGFFIYGESVSENKGALSHLKLSGQLIGNGFYSSQNLENIHDPVQAALRTDHLLTPYVTGSIFLMRFPGGNDDSSLAAKLNRQGLAKYAGPIVADIGGVRSGNVSGFSPSGCSDFDPDACTQSLLTAVRATGKGLIELPLGRPIFATVLRDFVTAVVAEGFQVRNLDTIPDVQYRIQQSGGTAGAATGAGSCDDY